MSEPVTFEILGLPAPQGSKSAVIRGDKPHLIEGASRASRERHVNWRSAVAEAARDWVTGDECEVCGVALTRCTQREISEDMGASGLGEDLPPGTSTGMTATFCPAHFPDAA